MQKKINKIIVTGAGGLVGSGIADFLEKKNFEVKRLTRNDLDLTGNSSVLNQIIENGDVIIHAAGVKGIYGKQMKENNILMTMNLINSIGTNKETKIIFCSSIDVINNDMWDYIESKKKCESMLAEFGKVSKSEVYLMRLGNIGFEKKRKINLLDRIYGAKKLYITELINVEKKINEIILGKIEPGVVNIEGKIISWADFNNISKIKENRLANMIGWGMNKIKRGGIYLYLYLTSESHQTQNKL